MNVCFVDASIGLTIENLTKTDPLEFGHNSNITIDVNHTANGVDIVLIEIGGTNNTTTYVSGNEYNYTWQPSAVGNTPFIIYANDTVGGEWNSLADSINVQDNTAPSPLEELM